MKKGVSLVLLALAVAALSASIATYPIYLKALLTNEQQLSYTVPSSAPVAVCVDSNNNVHAVYYDPNSMAVYMDGQQLFALSSVASGITISKAVVKVACDYPNVAAIAYISNGTTVNRVYMIYYNGTAHSTHSVYVDLTADANGNYPASYGAIAVAFLNGKAYYVYADYDSNTNKYTLNYDTSDDVVQGTANPKQIASTGDIIEAAYLTPIVGDTKAILDYIAYNSTTSTYTTNITATDFATAPTFTPVSGFYAVLYAFNSGGQTYVAAVNSDTGTSADVYPYDTTNGLGTTSSWGLSIKVVYSSSSTPYIYYYADAGYSNYTYEVLHIDENYNVTKEAYQVTALPYIDTSNLLHYYIISAVPQSGGQLLYLNTKDFEFSLPITPSLLAVNPNSQNEAFVLGGNTELDVSFYLAESAESNDVSNLFTYLDTKLTNLENAITNGVNNVVTQIESYLQANVINTLDTISTTVATINNTVKQINSTVGTINSNVQNILNLLGSPANSGETVFGLLESISSTLSNVETTVNTVYSIVNGINAQFSGISAQLSGISDNINYLKTQVDAINSAIEGTVIPTLNDINNLLAQIGSNVTDVKNIVTQIQSDVQMALDKLDSLNATLNTVNQKLDSINNTISSIKTTVESNAQSLQEALQYLDEIKMNITTIMNNITDLATKEQVQTVLNEINTVSQNIEMLLSEANSTLTYINELNSTIQSLKSTVESYQTQIANMTAELQAQINALNELTNNVVQLQQVAEQCCHTVTTTIVVTTTTAKFVPAPLLGALFLMRRRKARKQLQSSQA